MGTVPLSIDALQGAWTQSWTPTIATQLTYTAQLVDGFQSNPYRSVILAQGLKAQEHSPDHRARHSVAARVNFYIRPLQVAVRLGARAYRDTWNLWSGTLELEAERYFFEGFRLAARGRYYTQTGTSFWSDDYTGGEKPLGPKGQYFTGDRELSPFRSIALGLRMTYSVEGSKGHLPPFMRSLKVGAAAEIVNFFYDEYTLGGIPITDARAYVLGLNASASF